MNNYVCYHLHSDLSNGVTNVDSVTKFGEYISKAKECGMKALAFSEHGSIFEWFHKKKAIEEAGMKYIHAIECYLTEDLTEKIRDNYHCVLLAKNYAGFLELNKLISGSFDRDDNHFYYAPRISFEELFRTSDNILITTACIGGVFGKGSEETQKKFLDFLALNPERCFLEIGHHPDDKQVVYNKRMYELSQKTGLRLIAGTDTHVLNEEHEKGRSILQLSKNIKFDGEDSWDLKFKTYDQLVYSFENQASLPRDIYLEAIQNTNVLADMVEVFDIDRDTKYPHIYKDPERIFEEKIETAIYEHPYALKRHGEEKLRQVVNDELEVYKKTGSIDFMLLQTYLREWEKSQGIQCGYSRGSVSGSMIAYLLGITQMDSIKYGLNFFRFMNPDRVTNADIDTDYAGKDRDRVKQFLLRDKLNLPTIRSAEIITFNTIALKGAIRDVCRALYSKDQFEEIIFGTASDSKEYLKIANKICSLVVREGTKDIAPPELREAYPEVFKYVDIVNGTIVSIGTHPSGVLISDLPIDETIGLCTISSSDYPVSMVNMKELDEMMYVKLDILGLDNIGVINETCKILGIDRLTPDNVDMEDMDVWRSIRDDTTLIFQWESESAQHYIKKLMSDKTLEIATKKIPNFSMLKWMSFGNGLIRPACASFRDSVAAGEFYDNGFDALNEFLAMEAGRIAMQETIMQFLVKFCGYSNAESDTVRRGIAKKKGTEELLPEIKRRFISYSSEHYDISADQCAEVIEPFIKVITDASSYAFSWNHSDSYSAIGYICGYLRYYHPHEFLTAALNIFGDNLSKTADITKYASKRGIKVTLPRWGFSRGDYFFDKEKQVIAKGLRSVKYMSEGLADELYELSKKHKHKKFVDLLRDISLNSCIDSRQLEVLVWLDFFSEYGNQRELFRIIDMFNKFKKGDAKKIKRDEVDGTQLEPIVRKYSTWVKKTGDDAKSYTLQDVMAILRDIETAIKAVGMSDLSDTVKVRNFNDVMGYNGYVSGKEEDRRKLYIHNIYPLKRKKDGAQFGYTFVTQSIGSGIESRFTVKNGVFDKCPVQAGDMIVCNRWHRDGAYFHMTAYDRLI